MVSTWLLERWLTPHWCRIFQSFLKTQFSRTWYSNMVFLRKKNERQTFRIVKAVYWDWMNYRTSSMSRSNKIHVVYNPHRWQMRSHWGLHSGIEKNRENEAWVSLQPQSVFWMLQIWGWALVSMDLKKIERFRMPTPIHLWPRSCSL